MLWRIEGGYWKGGGSDLLVKFADHKMFLKQYSKAEEEPPAHGKAL